MYLTKSQLSRDEISCAKDKHICMSNIYAKEFSDWKFNEAVIDKKSIFQEIAQNFTCIH